MGMTADEVPAAPEVADLARVQKRGLADPRRDHEEVTLPAQPGELVSDVDRAAPAVVESQQQVARGTGEVDRGDQLRGQGAGAEALEVPGERRARQGVGD